MLSICHFCHLSTAAQACKKDTCYNIIATQGRNNPTLASRRADCSSILRSLLDDRTVTTTQFQTTSTTTTTVITSTSTAITTNIAYGKRDNALEKEEQLAELAIRDKIVIKGQRPAYATTACTSNTDYAIACLCFGIKPLTQSTLTKTIMTVATFTTISTSTETKTTTTGTTTVKAVPTSCTDDEKTFCENDGCTCYVSKKRQGPTCVDNFKCSTCNTDECCVDQNSSAYIFAFDDNALCGTRLYGICVTEGTCPQFPM